MTRVGYAYSKELIEACDLLPRIRGRVCIVPLYLLFTYCCWGDSSATLTEINRVQVKIGNKKRYYFVKKTLNAAFDVFVFTQSIFYCDISSCCRASLFPRTEFKHL